MGETERERALKLIAAQTVVSTQELTAAGVSRTTVQRLVADGVLSRVAHGVYMNPAGELTELHSLVEVQKQAPSSVVCLLSALRYHELGTQNPRRVWIAMPRSAWIPDIASPPVRIVVYSGAAFETGIQETAAEGATIRVYNVAKTIADCFKHRNKIGLDVALEALKEALSTKATNHAELFHYAKICRVQEVMRPYLESLA